MTPTMTIVLPILISIAMLFAGRRLFWFVIAVLGFYLGMKLAPLFIEAPTQSTLFMISAGIGILSAVVAIILQKMAIGIAGFLVGGYGAFVAMNKLGVHLGFLSWLPIVVLGIAGVMLAAFVFEWALILISSVGGAYLLVTSLSLTEPLEVPVFVVAALSGIFVQAKSMRKGKPDKARLEKQSNKD